MQIARDLVDRRDLLQHARVRSVHNMDQKVAVSDLLERRPKRCQKRIRQVANKSYGVINDHFLIVRQPQTP